MTIRRDELITIIGVKEMCDNTFENDDLKRDLNTLTISILCEEVTEDDK